MLVRYPPYYEYFVAINNDNEAVRELTERAEGPLQLPYDSETLVASASTNVRQLVDWLFVRTPSHRPTVDEVVAMRDQFDLDDDGDVDLTDDEETERVRCFVYKF